MLKASGKHRMRPHVYTKYGAGNRCDICTRGAGDQIHTGVNVRTETPLADHGS